MSIEAELASIVISLAEMEPWDDVYGLACKFCDGNRDNMGHEVNCLHLRAKRAVIAWESS